MKTKINLAILLLLILPLNYCMAQNSQMNGVKITGSFLDNTKIGDTVFLQVFEEIYSLALMDNPLFTPQKEYKALNLNGTFNFDINNADTLSYYNLFYFEKESGEKKYITFLGYLCKGDDLHFEISPTGNKASGIGKEQQNLKWQLDSLGTILFNANLKVNINAPSASKERLALKLNCYSGGLKLIAQTKNGITTNILNLIKMDFLSKYLVSDISLVKIRLQPLIAQLTKNDGYSKNKKITFLVDSVLASYHWNDLKQYTDTIEMLEMKIRTKSYIYPQYILSHYYINNASEQDLSSKYFNDVLQNLASQPLKERLQVYYFYTYYGSKIKDEVLLYHIINTTDNRVHKQSLQSLIDMKSVDKKAYDFTLPDSSGRSVRLSKYRGKLVIIDFWFTGCVACSEYYIQKLSKIEEVFKENKGVVFISISVDRNRETWIKSIKSGRYTSDDKPNVINLYTDGIAGSHPAITNNGIIGYPTLLIINHNGKIVEGNTFRNLTVEEAITRVLSILP